MIKSSLSANPTGWSFFVSWFGFFPLFLFLVAVNGTSSMSSSRSSSSVRSELVVVSSLLSSSSFVNGSLGSSVALAFSFDEAELWRGECLLADLL
jgi:hypothetical protein